MNDVIDKNPDETLEWIESFNYVYKKFGLRRANFILNILKNHVNKFNDNNYNYVNSIDNKKHYEKFILEKRIENIIKWNAVILVLKSLKKDPEIGGHLSTYVSASTLYEVGFNHFWRGNNNGCADLIYIQGHSAPGIYSRSYLEGRLSIKNINNFRFETTKNGLSSYPHPFLMPSYWQFPTVSMGLGPIQAVHKAKFIYYLIDRSIINKKNKDRKIWCMCGDGEMDEPEAISAINLAGREKLNNLIFVINCNLQRLDGPVRGNSNIINELECIFSSANWKVIKVIWNKNWYNLLKNDTNDILKKRMSEITDGDYQAYKGLGFSYMKEHFFNTDDLKTFIKDYSDEDIENLNYGGHDYEYVYSAYKDAVLNQNRPVVILAKTTKGFGLGKKVEAFNDTHSNKYISNDNLIKLKHKLNIPISNKRALNLSLYKPNKKSNIINYLKNLRFNLDGFIPKREYTNNTLFEIPRLSTYKNLFKEMRASSTMIIVQIISLLCDNKSIGKFIVPIVSDEARTFGMEILFSKIKIYSRFGQKYNPVDSNYLIYYNESKTGQFLQEGINEAGALSTWIASATSYSTLSVITVPFYIFYSMFGFQRVGDLIWAAADACSKGFLIGGVAGKTSLPGEGFQHCDGNSNIMSSLIPNCKSYDPAFSYELIVIINHGLYEMFVKNKTVFYYITTYNEKYTHPIKKLTRKLKNNIIKGIYRYKYTRKFNVELIGSGAILIEIIKTNNLLKSIFNIKSNIWSVTSFTELARNAKKHNIHNVLDKYKLNFLEKCFNQTNKPIIAVSDYNRLYVEQIREFIKNDLYVLTPDGFGLSDSRENLRKYFSVDVYSIIYTALYSLYNKKILSKRIFKYINKKYNTGK